MQGRRTDKMSDRLIEKKLKIAFPVFGYKLNVVITNSIDISRNKINSKVGVAKSNFEDCVGLHSHKETEPEAFIFITPFSTPGTIAHESSHAVYRMFEFYGLDFDDENFAYHLGFIVDKIHCLIRNKK